MLAFSKENINCEDHLTTDIILSDLNHFIKKLTILAWKNIQRKTFAISFWFYFSFNNEQKKNKLIKETYDVQKWLRFDFYYFKGLVVSRYGVYSRCNVLI